MSLDVNSITDPSLKSELREFGYRKVCISCPASFVCLTTEVHNVFSDGVIHCWTQSSDLSITFCSIRFDTGFGHCPFGVTVEERHRDEG